MAVHRLDQRRYMLGRGVLADAVAQVEDVRGACGVAVGVRLAKAVEHPVYLGRDLRGWCKQDVRVDVALQCFARAADLAAHE